MGIYVNTNKTGAGGADAMEREQGQAAPRPTPPPPASIPPPPAPADAAAAAATTRPFNYVATSPSASEATRRFTTRQPSVAGRERLAPPRLREPGGEGVHTIVAGLGLWPLGPGTGAGTTGAGADPLQAEETHARGRSMIMSAPAVRSALTACTSSDAPLGWLERMSAMRPATWGEDMLVPVLVVRVPRKSTERVLWPAVS